MVGNMIEERGTNSDFNAVKLHDGRILIIGGSSKYMEALSSMELYDPISNKLTFVGNMHAKRTAFEATLLKDGKVLITGGSENCYDGLKPVNSAEIFVPNKNN